jgi:hypothetical protein
VVLVAGNNVWQEAVLAKLMWIPGALLRVYGAFEDAFSRFKIVQVVDKLILPRCGAGVPYLLVFCVVAGGRLPPGPVMTAVWREACGALRCDQRPRVACACPALPPPA